MSIFSNDKGFSPDLLEAVRKIMTGEQELEEKKKMDPVGNEDGDVDNDGDEDNADDYLMTRRKAIKKSKKDDNKDSSSMDEEVQTDADKHRQLAAAHKEKMLDAKDEDHRDGMTAHRMAHDAHMAAAKAHDKAPDSHTATAAKIAGQKAHAASKKANGMFESADLDKDNVDRALKHDCATHVEHAEYGAGQCIPGMHTLEEDENGEGYVTHYDVMFKNEDGSPFIVEKVSVEEMKITKSESHMHKKK